ncbi:MULTISPECIES: TIGR03943 family protein [unclassified Streptomyces]|uniref:TIGR03943 family putative permease subunit n=1 Tax=unclassified Streptomyces TaxID=2593676 RepID=UPI000DDA9FAB|nr:MULTISPECIES: TIGR03943 family protein [unclassified Streptomyces]QZZ32854.1 TIGR03943 family protein [Streptomyces sp. ST1015]
MRRYGPAVLLVLVGAAVLRITLFGELYLRYVQAGLRPWLVISGVLLTGLGVAAGAPARVRGDGYGDGEGHACHGDGDGDGRSREGESDPHPGQLSTHRPRLAWLLALPALALLLYPPPALGSYSAGREAAARAAQGVGTFPALPAGDPVGLTVAAFSSRAVYDSGRSLTGRTVRMTGFVTRGKGQVWYLTRLLVTCCAADATTSKVEIRGAGAPAVDTWVTVTGTWLPEGELGSDEAWPPVLAADTVVRIAQPKDPYEKP